MASLSDVVHQPRAIIEYPFDGPFFVYTYEDRLMDTCTWVVNDWYEVTITRETIVDRYSTWRDELETKLSAMVWYSMPVHDEPG